MKRGDLVRLTRQVRIGEVEAPAGYVMRVGDVAEPGWVWLAAALPCLLCGSEPQVRVPLDAFDVVADV